MLRFFIGLCTQKLWNRGLGGFTCTWEGSTVAVFHNTTINELTVDLSTVTDGSFTVISGAAGAGEAKLNGTVLTVPGQTSVVLRQTLGT